MVGELAGQIRDALRRGESATLSNDQLRKLARLGFLHWLAMQEANELCRELGIDAPPAETVFRTAPRT